MKEIVELFKLINGSQIEYVPNGSSYLYKENSLING